MSSFTKCPVCHLEGAGMIGQDGTFDVLRCAECGVAFVQPIPSSEDLADAYADPASFRGNLRRGHADHEKQAEGVLRLLEAKLDSMQKPGLKLSILDYGCGYGTHLALAADRGWDCYGIELSDHARTIAKEALGSKASIGKKLSDLVPHCFDLIIILDVIEYLPDARQFFYELFRAGAIAEHTKFMLTTPNGMHHEAIADLLKWRSFHPPFHLFYYSAASLTGLFRELRFTQIRVSGIYPDSGRVEINGDETVPTTGLNAKFESSFGLMCEVEGSDFLNFMQERFVPGTWSALSAWEHLPRYLLSKKLAKGQRVLDFGCGSGYGSAMLASVASKVVGLDISPDALKWARNNHKHPNLIFTLPDELPALDGQPFDLVTCFEVIEHLTQNDQEILIERLAGYLAPHGQLLVSTPNPLVTAKYGENPYHLHELELDAFKELLGRYFGNVEILNQNIQTSTVFAAEDAGPQARVQCFSSDPSASASVPACWLAVCSHAESGHLPKLIQCFSDSSSDPISQFIESSKELNLLKFDLKTSADTLALRTDHYESVISEIRKDLDFQTRELIRTREEAAQILAKAHELARVMKTQGMMPKVKLKRLIKRLRKRKSARPGFVYYVEYPDDKMTEIPAKGTILGWLYEKTSGPVLAVRLKSGSQSKIGRALLPREDVGISYPLAGPCAGFEIDYELRPGETHQLEMEALLADGQWHLFDKRTIRSLPKSIEDLSPITYGYVVKTPKPIRKDLPRVLHAIANFDLGGSSRLLIDLIEHLGGSYAQEVVTSHIPKPPVYGGVHVTELAQGTPLALVLESIGRHKPDFIHVHYWGECDKPWYTLVFKAAEMLSIPVVQNVNTPVAPYESSSIWRNVFVSDTIMRQFGGKGTPEIMIHPGSDFRLFRRMQDADVADDCLGMVYRLENDKLNVAAIDPFIRCVRLRPQTRVLIVGGGSLLEPFKSAVEEAGLAHAFEFTGYVSYEKLPELYRRMSMFVAPVWKESFGQVSPFAMSMHLPVVGYDVGAIPEIVDDPSLVAPAGDSEALAVLMAGLLDDRPRRIEIGLRNSQRANDRFSVGSMIDAYRDLYALKPTFKP